MTRFNDPRYLEDWQATGRFPAIHDAIAAAILRHDEGKAGVDLCCSTGLLAERLRVNGFTVVGVDRDATALERSRAAGIQAELLRLHLDSDGLAKMLQYVKEKGLTSLYARRCLPELFGDNLPLGKWFFKEAAAAGITRVFLQGRNPTANAKNRLSSISAEIALASSSFDLTWSAGQVAYLQA